MAECPGRLPAATVIVASCFLDLRMILSSSRSGCAMHTTFALLSVLMVDPFRADPYSSRSRNWMEPTSSSSWIWKKGWSSAPDRSRPMAPWILAWNSRAWPRLEPVRSVPASWASVRSAQRRSRSWRISPRRSARRRLAPRSSSRRLLGRKFRRSGGGARSRCMTGRVRVPSRTRARSAETVGPGEPARGASGLPGLAQVRC